MIRSQAHLDRVLITGASGTLGYNIVRHLASTHPKTRIHLLLRKPDPTLFADFVNVGQQRADLSNIAAFTDAALDFQPNAIIHCAASGVRPSNIDWFDVINLNVASTVELFRASCKIPDCHFIHISTGLVYDAKDHPCHEGDAVDTLHPYGATKAAADCLLRAGADRLNRQLTIIRPFSFTGLHDGGNRLFPSLLRAAAEGRPFAMSAGTQVRDYCAVQDVAEAVCMTLDRGAELGEALFNVGSGQSMPLRDIVDSVVQQLGLNVEVHHGDRPFQSQEPLYLVADIRRMQALGWQPRSNLAYAVWELARAAFPTLSVTMPERFL
jgi:nucleoside-diphosphate-sugar epimerase